MRPRRVRLTIRGLMVAVLVMAILLDAYTLAAIDNQIGRE